MAVSDLAVLREAGGGLSGDNMRRVFMALALALAVPVAALASEIADNAAAAEEALEAGNALGAVQAFEKAQGVLWTKMPLALRTVEKAASAVGYGIYTPRLDKPYKPGEAIFIYVEPVGFGYGNDGLGNNSIELSIDLKLVDERGRELLTVDNVITAKPASRAKNRELYLGLNLSFDAGTVPPGKYRGDFVMRDRNSDKTAPFSVDFEIAN